jgi:hypothetical protein
VTAAVVLAACVTERRPSPPPPGGNAASPAGGQGFPVARPATGAVTVARVRVGVRPLGTVPYDGLTLPLVSPDGTLLAVQHGTAPGWAAVLALDDAITPLGASISVYDIREVSMRRVSMAEELPPGVMLGRAADAEGYLVEWPRPEGGRWIGKVAWASGRTEWLVQGSDINAHGVLTTHGELVFTRRSPGGDPPELILRARSGRELARRAGGGAGYMLPIAVQDPTTLYALVSSRQGLELETISLTREPEITGEARWGATLALLNLADNGEPSMAWQVAAPAQSTAGLWRSPAPGAYAAPEPLAVFHPRLERMAALDKASGLFSPLAERSIAASFWSMPGEQGFFCTAPAGLVFVPFTPGGRNSGRPPTDARVLGGAYVARVTTSPDAAFVLFGPSRADPGRLEVAAMAVVRGEPE